MDELTPLLLIVHQLRLVLKVLSTAEFVEGSEDIKLEQPVPSMTTSETLNLLMVHMSAE